MPPPDPQSPPLVHSHNSKAVVDTSVWAPGPGVRGPTLHARGRATLSTHDLAWTMVHGHDGTRHTMQREYSLTFMQLMPGALADATEEHPNSGCPWRAEMRRPMARRDAQTETRHDKGTLGSPPVS